MVLVRLEVLAPIWITGFFVPVTSFNPEMQINTMLAVMFCYVMLCIYFNSTKSLFESEG